VSTTDQRAALQVDALNEAGCYRVFVDTGSGAVRQRPELERLFDQLRPGDTVVVWRLDRLGRSLGNLVDCLERIGEAGAEFRSLTEAIDTSSPGGRLVFHLFAALAEFERDLIRERTAAGLAAARARGRKGGRHRAISADQVKMVRRMYETRDVTVKDIAAVFGVSRTTIYRYLATQESDAGTASGESAGGAGL
jgi:DNA invertase Pin-like site-specific DNA recombinase